MAYINKIKKKTTYKKHDFNAYAAKLRSSKRWIKLRDYYRMNHPLCEECSREGKTSPCEEIHHIRPLCTASDENEMEMLCFDASNLMALCRCCHDIKHGKKPHTPY